MNKPVWGVLCYDQVGPFVLENTFTNRREVRQFVREAREQDRNRLNHNKYKVLKMWVDKKS